LLDLLPFEKGLALASTSAPNLVLDSCTRTICDLAGIMGGCNVRQGAHEATYTVADRLARSVVPNIPGARPEWWPQILEAHFRSNVLYLLGDSAVDSTLVPVRIYQPA